MSSHAISLDALVRNPRKLSRAERTAVCYQIAELIVGLSRGAGKRGRRRRMAQHSPNRRSR